LSQNKEKMNGAYVGVIKKRTYEKLPAESIDLIKLDEWKRYVRPLREAKMISNFSDAGNTCRKCAILELERRFYGDKTEFIFEGTPEEINKKLQYTEIELGAIAIDPSTCLQEDLLDRHSWKQVMRLLQDEYVELFCTIEKKKPQETT